MVDRLVASLGPAPPSTHQYIVVGAGSAGSVVAGMLNFKKNPTLNFFQFWTRKIF
jgi:hypothetical protein